ncbi:MAG: Dabb family protein [Muribaculaceae bacterium]|nr:Dabb family protein [Muribaculaceae bacterium]
MFRLDAEPEVRADLAARFKEAIEALPALVPGLVSAEVGINDGPAQGNWDIVLTALCPDWKSLEEYSAHPEHLKCVAIIKAAIAGRACVDYIA